MVRVEDGMVVVDLGWSSWLMGKDLRGNWGSCLAQDVLP